MKGFIAIFKVRFNLMLQYKAAAYAAVFCQLFFGFVMSMVFEAFFEGGIGHQPMTLKQTVTYIWLGQGLLSLLPWNGDKEVQGIIRTGDVAYELVRPIGLYEYWFFKIMAQRIAPTLLRALPLFVIALVIMPPSIRMGLPVSAMNLILFLISLVGAVALGAAISNIITISTLFTIGDGMDRLFPAIVTLCSGMVIPIAFFPDWSQWLFRLLPFSGLTDAPYRFYLGIYGLREMPFILLHQIIWTVVLIGVGKWMVGKASQRIVVQGG